MKQTFSVKNISGMAVFSALSLVVYLLEIPIFAGTPANFLELDFSNVFVLLAGFMYGPLPAIIITLVKEGIHVFIGTTGGVGELANIIITTAFIIVPTILYRFKKGIVTVILSLVVASIIQSGISLLVNKYINFPFFMGSAPFKPTAVSNATFNELWAYVLAFNAIKSVAVSIVTILLYKKVSYLFRKIHLQNSRDSVYNKGGEKTAYNKDIEKTSNEFITKNAEETMQVACNFAKTLSSGEVLLLSGDLGAGKTVFTKGLAKGLNISDEVVSPTYAYLNVYGDYLYHYDCYRLNSGAEADALGLTDYFNQNNVCVIEWSENIADVLPKTVRRIKIEKLSDKKRKITIV